MPDSYPSQTKLDRTKNSITQLASIDPNPSGYDPELEKAAAAHRKHLIKTFQSDVLAAIDHVFTDVLEDNRLFRNRRICGLVLYLANVSNMSDRPNDASVALSVLQSIPKKWSEQVAPSFNFKTYSPPPEERDPLPKEPIVTISPSSRVWIEIDIADRLWHKDLGLSANDISTMLALVGTHNRGTNTTNLQALKKSSGVLKHSRLIDSLRTLKTQGLITRLGKITSNKEPFCFSTQVVDKENTPSVSIPIRPHLSKKASSLRFRLLIRILIHAKRDARLKKDSFVWTIQNLKQKFWPYPKLNLKRLKTIFKDIQRAGYIKNFSLTKSRVLYTLAKHSSSRTGSKIMFSNGA